MTVQAWIILTDEQRAAAEAQNDASAMVIPRVIDNPLAAQLGDPVVAVGLFVAPAANLNDPLFARWVPSLSVLPIRTLDKEVIFLPPPD